MNLQDLVLPTSAEELTFLRLSGETDRTLYSLISQHVINSTQDRSELIYHHSQIERLFLAWLLANPWAYEYARIENSTIGLVKFNYEGIYRQKHMSVRLDIKTRMQFESLIELKAA